MKSFLQFLREDVIPFYHRAHPEAAKRLQSGQQIYSSGLSVFLDPDMAKNYTAQTSSGHISDNAVTVTGKVPTSRVLPDLEWHPEAYNELLNKVNPERPPTLHVNRVTGGGQPFRYTIPGIRTEVDPQTGSKKIAPNWKFTKDASGKPVLQVGTSVMNTASGKFVDFDKGPMKFGGSATTGSKLGYQETPWLDVLGRKADLKRVTRDFIKTGTPTETGFKGFRTMGGSGVKIDIPNSQTTPKPTVKPSVPATGMFSKFKLPKMGEVSDLLDISSPAAVTTGAVVDLAKSNWDAIKTTPAWAAEKMGQKVKTPDTASIGQLEDGEEERKNTSSRYRK